jgi:hypothetical protein
MSEALPLEPAHERGDSRLGHIGGTTVLKWSAVGLVSRLRIGLKYLNVALCRLCVNRYALVEHSVYLL